MSDIFISYAKEDRAQAQLFAKALEGHGRSVFWDQSIAAGKTWRSTIGKELASAQCVMVLWSQNSVNSDWVLEEAEHAKAREVLVPVLIADVQLPLGFGRLHTPNLSHWEGTKTDPAFRRLVKDIATLIKPPKSKTLNQEPISTPIGAANLGTVDQESVDGITSIFPFVEFKADDKKVLRVHRFSNSCRAFYGYADNADLSYKSMGDLVSHMQSFIDPPSPHWDDFLRDQHSVLEKYQAGELPLAQVPIRFNREHPHFPGKTFVPLIVERNDKEGYDIMRVFYLDIAKLPKGVFGESIWSDLFEEIDSEKLSVELKQIADDWLREVPAIAPARLKALRDAAEEAAKGGSTKVVTLLGEAGFFALRLFAQKGDYPNAQVLLRRLLTLI